MSISNEIRKKRRRNKGRIITHRLGLGLGLDTKKDQSQRYLKFGKHGIEHPSEASWTGGTNAMNFFGLGRVVHCCVNLILSCAIVSYILLCGAVCGVVCCIVVCCSVVWCCAVLCCAVLWCVVLRCVVNCVCICVCVVLWCGCGVLCCIVLYCLLSVYAMLCP